MIAVEYLHDLRKAHGDDALSDLLAGAGAPFDRTEWWERLRRYCDLQPLYVVARASDGLALLPLQHHAGTVSALANWYTFRWRPLVTPGANAAELYEAVARDLSRHAWHVTLANLPEEDGTGSELARAFRRAGWLTRCRSHDSNHILHIAGRSYADYHASLPGPLRTTLKRKAPRVTCTIHTAFNDDLWAIYEAIYRESWKPEEGSPDFLRAFATSEAAAGRLRLGIASVAGEPVAAQLWTVEAGTAYIHKLAHRESARGHSPGSVLTAALFEQVIDHDHVTLVDFGSGNDPYKRDWMEDVRPRYRLDAWRLSAPQAWWHLARATGRSLQARLARRPGSG